MKNNIVLLLFISVCVFVVLGASNGHYAVLACSKVKKASVSVKTDADTIPVCIAKYLRAYPDKITGATRNSIIWSDGTAMIFDDGRVKSFEGLLDSADLEDQVCAMPYPLDSVFSNPKKNQDPGRVRCEPFFLKMYGSDEQTVKSNLVDIKWLPNHLNQTIKVSKVNGVAEKLAEISAELDRHPEFVPYLKNPGGTFNWRKISGTNRLSTHSFGITIDINVSFSNYWQWDNKDWKEKGEAIDLNYANRIPLEIVKIFEKRGFIWGGKWYHYDTMHFEYRPELLVPQ